MSAECMTADEFNRRSKLYGWKWVKLTNEQECHNGFQFKTGSNTDIKAFVPDSNCNDGIYFCKQEDILHWTLGHVYVRDVIIPPSATEFVVINEAKHKAKAHQIILGDRRELWDGEICKLAVQQDGYALRYVPQGKRTRGICDLAVQQNGNAIQYVPRYMITEEVCKLAVQHDGGALYYVPDVMITEEICKLAVQQRGRIIRYVPDAMRTEEICKLAVQQDGHALQFVPRDMRTEEICKLAIQQNGSALQCVPDDMRTEEICKLAVQQDGGALRYVPQCYDITV